MKHNLTRFEESVKNYWTRPALGNYKGETFTFGEVATQCAKLHLFFEKAGISKGEDCYNIIKAVASASGCSSAIAKAENPLKLAEEMISAVRRAYDETRK